MGYVIVSHYCPNHNIPELCATGLLLSNLAKRHFNVPSKFGYHFAYDTRYNRFLYHVFLFNAV